MSNICLYSYGIGRYKDDTLLYDLHHFIFSGQCPFGVQPIYRDFRACLRNFDELMIGLQLSFSHGMWLIERIDPRSKSKEVSCPITVYVIYMLISVYTVTLGRNTSAGDHKAMSHLCSYQCHHCRDKCQKLPNFCCYKYKYNLW